MKHLVLLALLLPACGLTVPITVEGGEQQVEGNGLCPDPSQAEALPAGLQGPAQEMLALSLQGAFDNLAPEIASTIEAQDTGPVQEVRLTFLELTQQGAPSDPEAINSLGFLTDLVLSVDSSELGPITVARAHGISVGATQITFAIEPGVDLEPYVSGGLTLTVDPELRTCPRQDVAMSSELSADLVF